MPDQDPLSGITGADRARFVRESMPSAGLFGGVNWRVSPDPFALDDSIADEIESMGRILLQFYRAVNLLYRRSVDGRSPGWVARWLDMGKPQSLIEFQRSHAFKNETPRVIRPDILLTSKGICITELDSVPGGIGLTAWLNQTYSQLPPDSNLAILGGQDGMVRGFDSIFVDSPAVHVVVSRESEMYRPEMEWLCQQLGSRFTVRDTRFLDFQNGDSVYRFFELFDLSQVESAAKILDLASNGAVFLTPPPKPIFEEKMLFALFWNRNLRSFWRQELGEGFMSRLEKWIPYTWLMDPAPMPPQAAIPGGLDLTDWNQLKALSQKERDLILKISGFSEKAWGARGVYLGSDLSTPEWSAAVDAALRDFETSPHVLQRFLKPAQVASRWYDFSRQEMVDMPGRARLCPYYFVSGQGDRARPALGGVLATVVPADKKIVHGMSEAILAPCARSVPSPTKSATKLL